MAGLPRCEPDREPSRGRGQADLFQNLEERELLYALLCHCLPWGSAATAAAELVERFGTFAEVIAAPHHEITALPSVPPAAAALLKCVHGAALRLGQSSLRKKVLLKHWAQLRDYLQMTMAREPVEQFRVLFLDTKNQLIEDEVCNRGDVNHVMIYPRQVIKRAIELNATALIVAHNHPSGDPAPSQQDIDKTREICRAAATFEIVVHDHLVIGRNGTFSFREAGLL
ncbi:RadC family protein [Roseicella aquatilis]|nr:DNA repair protein RadC [Roseicella aquatilis]